MDAYAYIYDADLAHPRHQKELNKLETLLTDMGLHGRIHRLTPLKSISELVNDEYKQGAKTIVAVGNDSTFHQLISIPTSENLVVGFIPFATKSVLAPILNIHSTPEACQVLSQRLLRSFSLQVINKTAFIFECVAKHIAPLTVFHLDEFCSLTISGRQQHTLFVCQQIINETEVPLLKIKIFPTDRPEESSYTTTFYTKKLVIESPESMEFSIDEAVTFSAKQAQIFPTTKSIRCVVGRERVTPPQLPLTQLERL